MFNTVALFQWVEAHLNYWTILMLMAIESSFIPFPSEVVVPPAAYFASQPGSELNVVLVVVVATIGALIGAAINYGLSIWIGRPLVYAFARSRVGHMLLIDEKKVANAEEYFDRHGAVATLVGRLIPAVRQLISIPAGLARMNFGKFALYTSIGAGVWNCVLALLGYLLSLSVARDELIVAIERYNGYLNIAGYALLAVVVIILVRQGMKKSSPAEKGEQSENETNN